MATITTTIFDQIKKYLTNPGCYSLQFYSDLLDVDTAEFSAAKVKAGLTSRSVEVTDAKVEEFLFFITNSKAKTEDFTA